MAKHKLEKIFPDLPDIEQQPGNLPAEPDIKPRPPGEDDDSDDERDAENEALRTAPLVF